MKEGTEGLEERSKRQRIDDVNPLIPAATTSAAIQNQPQTETTTILKTETLVSANSEKDVITRPVIMESSTNIETPTQTPNQPQDKSGSETVTPPEKPKSQNPERERTQQSQGDSEPQKPPEQTEEHSIVTTTTTEIPSTQPTDSEKEQSEMGSVNKSDLLITSEVEEDNTIVSVGDYSFHTKSKAVMRRRTKRAEGVVVWTQQRERPEERSIQSTSALGAFAVMNLSMADDTRKEIESLRTQVAVLTQDLHISSLERVVLMTRAEQEESKQRILAAEKEEL